MVIIWFFYKQKTAYEMRTSDWSSDVCSSDLLPADHQVSIVSMADAGGALAGINSYDEWGVPDVGNSGRFQYTGQAWIPELGMYHYKARVYSPTLGRFLQTDPKIGRAHV